MSRPAYDPVAALAIAERDTKASEAIEVTTTPTPTSCPSSDERCGMYEAVGICGPYGSFHSNPCRHLEVGSSEGGEVLDEDESVERRGDR
jgi:hypothetical protein